MILNNLITLTFITLFSSHTFSHSGGTIKKGNLKGCHNNHKPQSFHCHSKANNLLKDKNFSSIDEARLYIGGSEDYSANSKSDYNRKEFKHWIDEDGNCLNTRAEVLKTRSLKEVSISNCRVTSGLWLDYYYDEALVSASSIDIDHIVPLKEAWISGANDWSSERRSQFANDTENLVITNLKYNRQKGAKTPLEWLPVDKAYACKYIKEWLNIKKKYNLSISSALIEQYERMNCL